MLGVGYFGTKPTQIRLTAAEYLSPIQRNELTIRGSAFGTNWTRDMLLRLQQLSQSGLEDATILTMLKEEFNGPETVAEITQERVFMAMRPKEAFWTQGMVETVVELYEQGFNTKDLMEVLMRRFKRPSNWTEVYRKIQELKLLGLLV
ncbi:MAG: hypothetical protein L6R39_001993 [Caloplaca ligustica]|nr:MAG: hypothetical protein L6R39_001993 [Caloplaca ligustica]